MKRPMCVIGLTLVLTTLAAFSFSARVSLLLSGAAAATGMLLAVLRKKSLRVACLACMAAALGLAVHSAYSTKNILPFERAGGETVAVQGFITEAAKGNRAIFYTLDARFPDRPDLPDTTLSLRTFGEMEYGAGEVIGCDVILDEEVAAPGDYTFSRGGFASGQAVNGITRLSGGYPIRRRLTVLRSRMEGNLYECLPEQNADLLSAMVLGLNDNVDSDTYAAVNRAGTAHLLSVSGLHLSILTAALLRLLEGLRVKGRAASLAAIGAAVLFAGLVGFSASIIRALLMTTITFLAQMGSRRKDSLSSLAFAVTVICLARPVWVLGRGFWFSACSTLGILLFSAKLEEAFTARLENRGKVTTSVGRFFLGAGAVSIAAYVFTLPLSIFFSGWISLVSPLANLLAAPFEVPLIGGGILCALFGGGPLLMGPIVWFTNLCMTAVLQISRLMAELPFATAPMDDGWMVLWLVMVVAGALLLYRFRANGRLVGWGALLAALVFCVGSFSQAAADRGRVQLAVIENCDAAVLLRGREAVVLGTPTKSEINRLLRYLEFRGVTRISAIVATDCGEQVGSGLIRLGQRYAVDCVIGPDDAYIVNQIAQAMPGVPVYPGGSAKAELLGGARIETTAPGGAVRLTTTEGSVLKSPEKYGILEDSPEAAIQLYADGVVILRAAGGYDPSPMGGMLFGERRFRLRV